MCDFKTFINSKLTPFWHVDITMFWERINHFINVKQTGTHLRGKLSKKNLWDWD